MPKPVKPLPAKHPKKGDDGKKMDYQDSNLAFPKTTKKKKTKKTSRGK